MAQTVASVCRRCRQALPYYRRHLLGVRRLHAVRALSAEAAEPLPPPSSDGGPKTYPERIRNLVSEISQLTLAETAQLNELLKTTLNIADAPVMSMGAMPAASPSQEAEEKQEEQQSEFTVKLVKFSADSKVKLIKEVKVLMEGMNLVQSKKFVESLPQVVHKDVSKEEAERLKTALEAAGGTVEIE